MIQDFNIHEPINKSQKTLIVDVPSSKDGCKSDLDYVFDALKISTRKNHDIQSKWVVTGETTRAVTMGNRVVSSKQVPRVIGMGARDAVYMLETLGLKVLIEGRGAVSKQSLPAGAEFKHGDQIKLTLT